MFAAAVPEPYSTDQVRTGFVVAGEIPNHVGSKDEILQASGLTDIQKLGFDGDSWRHVRSDGPSDDEGVIGVFIQIPCNSDHSLDLP
jgi:hypothetical protein